MDMLTYSHQQNQNIIIFYLVCTWFTKVYYNIVFICKQKLNWKKKTFLTFRIFICVAIGSTKYLFPAKSNFRMDDYFSWNQRQTLKVIFCTFLESSKHLEISMINHSKVENFIEKLQINGYKVISEEKPQGYFLFWQSLFIIQ